MASLVDTNVLVYRFDPREPEKRDRAEVLLRRGAVDHDLLIPYQAIAEFVSVVLRPRPGTGPLLDLPDAIHVADSLLQDFEVLYPTEMTIQTAYAGAAVHGLPWYDACLWAYAESSGIPELLSEDFQHGRIYGRVRVRNPFL